MPTEQVWRMIVVRANSRWLMVSAVLASMPACNPSAADVAGDVAQGKVIALRGSAAGLPACSGCHGAAGEGQAGGTPRLAALPAAYIERQLDSFRNGSRDNAAMTPVAKMMDRGATADAAAYYAGLALPAGTAGSGGEATTEGRIVALGEDLARRGDWSRNVPACAACHGAQGLGVGTAFPPLAGQSAAYIVAQLGAWRDGSRHDEPLGLMRSVSTGLDAAQIAAVAAYYGSLPPTGAPR